TFTNDIYNRMHVPPRGHVRHTTAMRATTMSTIVRAGTAKNQTEQQYAHKYKPLYTRH
ncbi:unnamed protein product, partial [Ceratitis capitata]